MIPYTPPQPVSPPIKRTFVLDNAAKAVDEFIHAYEGAILLVIFNVPELALKTIRQADRATRPVNQDLNSSEPKKEVLLIQDEAVLAALADSLKASLPEGKVFEDSVAVSVVRGTGAIAHVIGKGELNSANMGTAINQAIIALANTNPS